MERRNDSNTNTENILNLIKPPDLLSILNALLGFSAILLVMGIGGITVTEEAFKKSLILILLAVVADGLDGIVARKTVCSILGEYLDSLADMVSFGLAPAIIVCVFIMNYLAVPAVYIGTSTGIGTEIGTGIVLVFCGAYLVCGMLRLARFSAIPKNLSEKESISFEGFPITASAALLASFMLLTIELQLPPYSSALLLIGLIGLLCLLMSSRIRYRKPRGKLIVISTGIAFSALFVSYIFSFAFIYAIVAVTALTVFYLCSPSMFRGSRFRGSRFTVQGSKLENDDHKPV